MTAIAGDLCPYPVRSGKRDRVFLESTFTIGAAGAVSATDADDPAITLTYASATGDYDLTFPKCPDARIWIQLESDTLCGVQIQQGTLDASAGTASLLTLAWGTAVEAADPASGDKIHVLISVEARS